MKIIGVINNIKKGHRRLFESLEKLFLIRFEERLIGNDAGIDAWFLNDMVDKDARIFTNSGRPTYAIINSNELIPCGQSTTINFSKHCTIPALLRGRQIETNEAEGLMALSLKNTDQKIIASKAGYPVWVTQEIRHCQHHYVAVSIPELNEDEPLFRYFNGRQFLQLLPFLLFLRSLTEDEKWEPPPLQACFMFDDPNLHWPTYGFIKFNEMVHHAIKYSYHTSFATIPIDAWFINTQAAAIFKENKDKLSLLIHGNDHISNELSRKYSEKKRNEVLNQALKRIEDLERRSGVEVSKVMAPPHGACSEAFLAGMAHVGFEGACISSGSLQSYNKKAKWLSTLGMMPSDIIEGLTVFPRFGLSNNCQNRILIAAFLHQPIIPMGHHQDVSDGLKTIDDLSIFINSLGDIQWADMKSISRSHFAKLIDGGTLHVKMFTKRIEVSVPEGIKKISVECPSQEEVRSEYFSWRMREDQIGWIPFRLDESIPVSSGQTIEIISIPTTFPHLNDNEVGKFRIWPIIRRQMTELRDRITPAWHRLSVT